MQANNSMSVEFSSVREQAREEYEKFLGTFLRDSPVVARRGDPKVADLVFGDPHDPSLSGIAEALHAAVDVSADLGYRYLHHLPEAREAATDALSQRTGLNFESDDLFLNTGAFSGLVCCLQALCDPGSEALYLSPPWFYYRSMIKSVGAIPKGVDLNPEDWGLPLDAIKSAIGPKTSAVLINSPHNPSGKVLSDEELSALAEILTEASRRLGREIPIISDEAYSRIVFDQAHAPTPARHYAATIVLYTYGKTLLAPSLRMGYMALAPGFPDSARMRRMFDAIQPMGGWLLPTCIGQRALPQLENLCVDLEQIKRRRDHLVSALREGGYRVVPAEGTFYMLVDSPDPDDIAFSLYLESRDVLVLPGSVLETPGTFRVSLTASDRMIEQAAEVFRKGYTPESPK
ncbi:MAG: aminotransferase class I/II-fold pyridoxal phosphate-dependent enzyme [Candidatus Nitrohelix vancouverensis]|uniref:Aminotransferase class I/II-fold pyridoxal phosphate-dependent enzyme n=1 Tax=Candidatus Nitrohelix vancouverensis TaxID=2705534 RepID=A0A7T0C0L8_9BACT|nr:MAG: aminotransferase class I/II-fold pyridoxal phosphate-dependent enzyme [Candidatus Nitrohelix vancouverensis]